MNKILRQLGVILLGLAPFAQMSAQTPSPNVTLTGQMQGANGLPAANQVLTFQPTQTFFLVGTGTPGGCAGGTLFEHNGAALVNQCLLNFNDTTPAPPGGGTNVIFQTDASGNLSGYVPAGAGGILLQTNSVNNSSQTLLNLIAGSNMAVTNTSGGNVRFDSLAQTTLPPPFPVPSGQAVAWAYPSACTPSGLASNGTALCGTQSGYVIQTESLPLGQCCFNTTWNGFAMPLLPGDAVIQGVYGVEFVQHTTETGLDAALGSGKCTFGTGHNLNTPSSAINFTGEYYTPSLGSTSSVVTGASCTFGTSSSLGPEAVFDENHINQVAIAIYYTTASPPPVFPYTPIPTNITLQVNGSTTGDQGLLNLNATTPAAPSGNTNVTFQTDSNGNVSAYFPNGAGTVTQILAGINVTISPTGGTGAVTINSSGSTLWNTIGNPTGNQALTMGTDTSTWTYTNVPGSGSANLTITDNATAGNASGDLVQINDGGGAASAATLLDLFHSGNPNQPVLRMRDTNGYSVTMEVNNVSGFVVASSGGASAAMPAISAQNGDDGVINLFAASRNGYLQCNVDSASTGQWCYAINDVNASATNGLWRFFDVQAQGSDLFNVMISGAAVTSSGLYKWSSTAAANGAPDTGLSRDSAGVIDFGTGAQGSTAGSLKATNSTLSGVLTLSAITGSTQCAQFSTSGVLSGTGSACGSGGSSAFSAITSGTNTTAAMLVGTGASLAPTGSGTITANAVNLAASGNGGVTGLLPHANIAATAVTPGSYTNANITVAADGSITAAANGSSGGSVAFSGITAATNTNALVMGTGGSLTTSGSGSINATLLGGVALSGLCQTGGTGCPQLAVTKASVSHQFFTSYTSSTGVFTAAQPAFTDISGQATLAQLPTLSANQVLGALTATTPSGLTVPSCSGATNALIWTSGTGFGCNTISGSGTVSGQASGVIPLGTSATVIGNQSHLDDGVTTAATITSSEPFVVAPASGKAGALSLAGNTTLPTLITNDFNLIGPATATATAYGWQVPSAVNGSAGIMHVGAPTSAVSQLSVSLVSLTADVTGLLSHANIAATAVTPGSYTNANITVAADGSITAAANGSSGGGDTITSPNGTLTIGGTSTNTTLDVAGSAGKILAGATPALTFTPALGVDGTSAGTLQLANGSAAFHTIWASGATANNTIQGFATVPTTGHLIDCTVTSTTCLLHDSGVVTANVLLGSSLTAGVVHAPGSSQTMTSSLIVNADITNATITGAKLVNNTITATQLAAQYSKGSCTEVWGGSGTSFALTSGDDAISNNTCYNDSGVTRTITAVKCRVDAASNTTTVNPTFGSAGTGTTILSGALTCGSSLAYSSSGTVTNASWTTGSGINPVQGGTLTGTSVAVIYEYTY